MRLQILKRFTLACLFLTFPLFLSIGLTGTQAASYPSGCSANAPCTITTGMTLSHLWFSGTNSAPAISLKTDAQFTCDHCTLEVGAAGGIVGIGTNGLNLKLTNSTIICFDPRSSGSQRGRAVLLTRASSADIENNFIVGCSQGIDIEASPALTSAIIRYNFDPNHEDRMSDGNGGVTRTPANSLGHFVFLGWDTLPNGADIGWNVFQEQVPFRSSVNDVINFYQTACSATAHCLVHDNYCEGNVGLPVSQYTGSCVIADGSNTLGTSYVEMDYNYAVHYGNAGFAVASGNHNGGTGNLVVNCGQDSGGNWLIPGFSQGIVVSNYYGMASSSFVHNVFTNTTGGLVRPLEGSPLSHPPNQTADSYIDPGLDPSNSIDDAHFTDPCTFDVHGVALPAAEIAARTAWAAHVAAAGVTVGPLGS